jgi:MFS family permease
MGMNMQMLVRGAIAWELTNSYSATAFLMVAFMLPQMFFTLPGGALVDRVEKRNMMMLMQATMAAVAVITGAMVITDTITAMSLFVLGLVQGAITSLGMPARTPLMAEIVPQNRIASAMALSNNSMNLTRAFGPLVAGILMTTFPHVTDRFGAGYEWAYFVQGGFGVLSVALLLFVPTSSKKRASQIAAGMVPTAIIPRGIRGISFGDVFSDVTAGLKYVVNTPTLRTLMVMMLILTFFAMPFQNLMAGYVELGLGITDWQGPLGDLLFISGLGALFGSALMTWLAEWDRRPLLQWFAGLLCSFGMVALTFGAFRFGFVGAAVGVTLLGIGTTVYMTASSTMMLLSAKREYYGRVMSIFMLSFSAMAVTVYPLGLAADLLGTPLLFGLLGIVVLVCMLVAVIVNPGFTFGRVSANPVMAVQSTSIDQSDSLTEVASESNFVKKSQINPEKPLNAVQQSSVAINRTISRQRGSRLGAAVIQTTYGLGEISREKKINLMRGTKIGNYGLGHFLDGEATSNSFDESLSLDQSLENDEVEPLLQSSFDEVIEDIEPDENNTYKTKNSSQYRPDIDTDALKSFFVVRNQPSRWRKMFVVGSGAAAITAVVMRFYERVDQ